MAIKTLKTKRIFAYLIYTSLKNTPPKEYPTTGEIKTTISDILPSLKKEVGEYLDMQKKAEGIREKEVAKEITTEESVKQVTALNVDWKKYSKEHGEELVELMFEEETLKTLRGQFDREGWGKTWVANIDEFSELSDAFVDASK